MAKEDSFISPFRSDGTLSPDAGEVRSVNGAPIEPFHRDTIAEVLYHGGSPDDWDGTEAVVVRLVDGRVAAWETWWGPTGNGFWEDAYGGGTEIWVAYEKDLPTLILQALTDFGREMCGIPREGLSS